MGPKINTDHFAGKKILVAPLDWGLGHATRCIPLVKIMLDKGSEVWLAGNGAQEILLKREFPYLPFLPLNGYDIKYSSSGFIVKLLSQVPGILKSIRQENRWLNDQMTKHAFDFILSDNRYGLYHKKACCIFITHQLCIKSPLGSWSEKILQYWNYHFISRFTECWVPDEEGENNLAGELSHPKSFPPIPVTYMGPLSRFSADTAPVERSIKNHLLVMLSGPEPQRSIFENIIVRQIAHYNGSATVVRGRPADDNIIPSTGSIRFYNHADSGALKEEMEKAEFIICRSGYSSIMDIAAMKKKSILIPTPGQTEQEYLAGYLMKKNFAYSVRQKEFSLQEAISNAGKFEYRLNL